MRFAPRSLFSRLVLVQLTVLIVALLVSFAIHMQDRTEALARASGMQTAQRIADIVRLLEPLSAGERRRIVQVFSAPPLTISLDEPPLRAGVRDARGVMFASMLARFLGDRSPVAVAVQEVGVGVPMPALAAPPFSGHKPWMGGGRVMHFGAQPAVSFVAQVRLSDGALLTFDSR